MNSKLFQWQGWDFLKGGLMAAMAVLLSGIYQFFSNGQFPAGITEWKPILISGASAFIGYLLKNFFTNSSGQLLTKEQDDTKGGDTPPTKPPVG